MWTFFFRLLKTKGEGVQGGPGGVQREEQRESADSQQANRGKISLNLNEEEPSSSL